MLLSDRVTGSEAHLVNPALKCFDIILHFSCASSPYKTPLPFTIIGSWQISFAILFFPYIELTFTSRDAITSIYKGSFQKQNH